MGSCAAWRRPAKALLPSEDELRVTDVKDGPAISTRLQQPQTIALFLETPVPPSTELPPINKSIILLFLKFYEPKTQTLRVRAPVLAPKTGICHADGLMCLLK